MALTRARSIREQVNPRPSCWTASTLIGRPHPHKGGHAVFARRSIRAGELLAVFGGDVVPGAELSRAGPALRRLSLQIDEDLYVVSGVEGPGDWFNHSCEPNAGLRGQLSLVALRPIKRGEEVCYDYAMSDGTSYDEFPCACGASLCRHRVTGDDWRLPELWARYEGHFSPYLQQRIERLVAGRMLELDEPIARMRVRAQHPAVAEQIPIRLGP